MGTSIGFTFDPDAHKRKPFTVFCRECKHEWAPFFAPIDLDTAATLLKSAKCPVCDSHEITVGPVPRATRRGAWQTWVHNGDTGISSLTIWSVMTGLEPPDGDTFRPGIPSDPSDFGRCYRLLKIMPSWRPRLPEVAAIYPNWKPLVDVWDELTALYEEELPSGVCSKLYARMKELTR